MQGVSMKADKEVKMEPLVKQMSGRERSVTRNRHGSVEEADAHEKRSLSIDRQLTKKPNQGKTSNLISKKALTCHPLDDSNREAVPKKKLQFKDDTSIDQQNKAFEKSVSAISALQSALKSKTSLNNIQTCKCFQYSETFLQVRDCFLKFSRQKKYSVVHSSNEQATSRKGSFGSCGCIMRLFASDEPAVYQVKICSGNKAKAKILLIEGSQADFHQFSGEFLVKLWQDNLLKATQSQHIQYFVMSNQRVTKMMLAECKHITAEVKEEMDTTRADGLVKTFRRELNKLKRGMAACTKVVAGSYSERKLEEMIYTQVKIFQLYSAMYYWQNNTFLKKKQKIRAKLQTETIFQHLQISQHFTLFSQLISRKEQSEVKERPYESCIKWLQEMKESDPPALILQKVSIFNQRVKQNYLDYHVQRVRVSDMDDFLPITIYCVLEAGASINLLAVVKFLLVYLSEEEEFQCEKKILATMEAAIDYILNQWLLDVSIEDHFLKRNEL